MVRLQGESNSATFASCTISGNNADSVLQIDSRSPGASVMFKSCTISGNEVSFLFLIFHLSSLKLLFSSPPPLHIFINVKFIEWRFHEKLTQFSLFLLSFTGFAES